MNSKKFLTILGVAGVVVRVAAASSSLAYASASPDQLERILQSDPTSSDASAAFDILADRGQGGGKGGGKNGGHDDKSGKSDGHGKSGDDHGKDGDDHGKAGDDHGNGHDGDHGKDGGDHGNDDDDHGHYEG